MKKKIHAISTATKYWCAGLVVAGSATAATITPGDPNAGGIGYAYQVELGAADSGAFSSHVGAWSWEDEGVFTPPDPAVGWTHTSNWVALNLTSDASLSISLARDSAVPFAGGGNILGFADTASMFPSLTIWKNWDNDLAPQAVADLLNAGAPMDDFHTYNNHGAVDWAEDLVYFGHIANNTLTSISGTWDLPAGQYTLVFGSNAPSASNPPRQGYQASFSTSPIPEPGSLVLFGIAALGLVRRRAGRR